MKICISGRVLETAKAKDILWKGQSDRSIDLFKLSLKKIAPDFCNNLEKHRYRIVNYEQLLKQQICSIGSGAVESTVKQIDRRLNISGAQWLKKNVNQMLKFRCADLNDLLAI